MFLGYSLLQMMGYLVSGIIEIKNNFKTATEEIAPLQIATTSGNGDGPAMRLQDYF